MKLFVRTGPGTLSLNYMWLPTFVGMNGQLIKEIEEYVAPFLLGKELTDETLEQAGDAVISFLSSKFPHIKGIYEYLDGLKYVETDGEAKDATSQEGRPASSPG